MFSTNILNALNVSSVTSTLDYYVDPATGAEVPALMYGLLVPSDCTAKKTLNFYQTAPVNHSLNYGLATFTASCRAPSQVEAEVIAKAVTDEISRKSYGSYYLFCQTEQTIRPEDATDTFNTPVTITIKQR